MLELLNVWRFRDTSVGARGLIGEGGFAGQNAVLAEIDGPVGDESVFGEDILGDFDVVADGSRLVAGEELAPLFHAGADGNDVEGFGGEVFAGSVIDVVEGESSERLVDVAGVFRGAVEFAVDGVAEREGIGFDEELGVFAEEVARAFEVGLG